MTSSRSSTVSTFDETELRVFLHSPFGDASESERNDTSVAMQITLGEGEGCGRLLVFGDLEARSLERIFDYSDAEDVAWDVFLAPHHCSRSALFEKDGNGRYVLKSELVLAIADAASSNASVVLSSTGDFTDTPGSYPPHAMAREQYEAIAPGRVLCTAEHPAADFDDPIVLEISESGINDISVVTSQPPSEATSAAKPFAIVTRRPLIESPGG